MPDDAFAELAFLECSFLTLEKGVVGRVWRRVERRRFFCGCKGIGRRRHDDGQWAAKEMSSYVYKG